MAEKTFIGTGDTPMSAAFDVHKQIADWVATRIPYVIKTTASEVTTGDAQYRTIHIGREEDRCGISIKMTDGSTTAPEEPRIYIGIYDIYSEMVHQHHFINITPFYNPTTQKLTFSLPYNDIPNGFGVNGNLGKLFVKYNEQLGKNIISSITTNYKCIIDSSYSSALNLQRLALFPGYSVPQPQPNKCTMSNAVYEGKLLDGIYTYNCNPTLPEHVEVTLGGEQYYTLYNNCCIKL